MGEGGDPPASISFFFLNNFDSAEGHCARGLRSAFYSWMVCEWQMARTRCEHRGVARRQSFPPWFERLQMAGTQRERRL